MRRRRRLVKNFPNPRKVTVFFLPRASKRISRNPSKNREASALEIPSRTESSATNVFLCKDRSVISIKINRAKKSALPCLIGRTASFGIIPVQATCSGLKNKNIFKALRVKGGICVCTKNAGRDQPCGAGDFSLDSENYSVLTRGGRIEGFLGFF